jgi:outer membrane protein TolC
MHRVQSIIAIFFVYRLILPVTVLAQDVAPMSEKAPLATRSPSLSKENQNRLSKLLGNYEPSIVSPVNEGNSSRLDSMLRAGNLYLSLQDVIALALENNVDVEVQRYDSMVADANLLRAKAGGALRGNIPSVSSGPSSASTTTNVTPSAPPTSSFSSSSVSSGTSIPTLDPTISGSYQYQHSSSPQSSLVVTGTNVLVNRINSGQISYNQGFLTGTNVSLGYSDTLLNSNSTTNLLNPYHTGALSLSVSQHILQGFGLALNRRNIDIARNNRELADLQFKQQVIATTTSAMLLYWNLVSFIDDVKAKQDSLSYNERLYSDNKKQVAIGTLAPIEVVRAEAAVASSQQDLLISQTRVLQQETILKDYLSRNGVASPSVQQAHVIPTDHIQVPNVEPIQPLQDLVTEAMSARPELAIARINVTNAKINLRGSRSELLPSLDAFGALSNNGLAGTINALPGAPGIGVSDALLGGYGSLFTQIFGRNFPNYSLGVQVNIPVHNRVAQADYVLDQVNERQQELARLQAEKQVRVQVQNALIGLQQARTTYQTAVKERVLQEQTLDGEQRKLALGASTILNVILVQRDVASAQSAEVAALNSYAQARVALDYATGQVLVKENISMDEAFRGQVSRPPSTPPAKPER